MNKYVVIIQETSSYTAHVSAENESDAIDLALSKETYIIDNQDFEQDVLDLHIAKKEEFIEEKDMIDARLIIKTF